MKFLRISLVLILCCWVSERSYAQPRVLASIKPLALLAQDLVGDLATVEVLLGPNTDPHHYTLTISDRKKLQQADLVMWMGPNLEQFLVKPLASARKSRQLVVSNLEGHGGKEADDFDPHLWLSPKHAAAITQALAQRLATDFPAMTAQIHQRLEERLVALDQLRRQLQQTLAPYRGKSFIGDHPAYQQFVVEYGVIQLGSIQQQEGIGPSARHMAGLSEMVAERQPNCLLVEAGRQNQRGLQRWSARWQLPLVPVDVLGADATTTTYADLMASIAKAISACFE